MADKYDSPIVTDFARVHLRPRVDSSPATVFGVAVVFKDLDLAHEALEHFESALKNQPELSRPSSSRAGRSEMPYDIDIELPPSARNFRTYNPVPPRLGSGRTTTRADFHGSSTDGAAPPPTRKRTHEVTLSDVPIEYLRRFSAETIQSFTRLQDDERSWPEKASLFKVSPLTRQNSYCRRADSQLIVRPLVDPDRLSRTLQAAFFAASALDRHVTQLMTRHDPFSSTQSMP